MSKVAYINGFSAYIKLEKSLSANSNEAYKHDVELLYEFLQEKHIEKSVETLSLDHLQQFIQWINERNLSARSQARIISGIKAFYKFLLLENIISDDPTTLLETPKLGRKLPEFLTIQEIDTLLNAIDLSTAEGQRNRAMLETLYSSGLRVSELISLKKSNSFFDIGFLKITGKGNKERLVPIGSSAIKHIHIYEVLLLTVKKMMKFLWLFVKNMKIQMEWHFQIMLFFG